MLVGTIGVCFPEIGIDRNDAHTTFIGGMIIYIIIAS